MKLIDGKTAQAEWNDEDDGRVSELIVYDSKAVTPEEADRLGRKYISSHGVSNADWMDGTRAVSTPEGVFLGWLLDGFTSDEVMLNALDQLGQIKEAEWARTMAKAFREIMIQREGGEDEAHERWASPVYED